MKRFFSRALLAGGVFLFCPNFCGQQACALPDVNAITSVRVLLDEQSVQSSELWTLKSDKGFVVSDLIDADRQQVVDDKQLVIGIKARTGTRGISVMHDAQLTINGRGLVSEFIKIESMKGPLTYDKHTYNGTFVVIKHGGVMQLINCVGLEEYVACGVRWEMMPHWPAAALEAGAVAYRTYVVSTVHETRMRHKKERHNMWFDIRSTSINQVYKGTHTYAAVHDAVKKTKGLIVTYRKEPIRALYDACCGGSIPSKRSGVDFVKAPYLARAYPCTACKACKYFNWSYSYVFKELAERIKTALSLSGPVTDIKIEKKDGAGVVQTVAIKTKKAWTSFPARTLMSVCDIKSGTFTLKKRGSMVVVDGKGFGHQLGLCQWGAYGLAKRGWNFRRILRFYYPGTSMVKTAGA